MRAIIAKNNLGFIGLNGGLPWKCKKDLQHFKRLTLGHILLVGYNTLQTLPDLKGRIIAPDIKGLKPSDNFDNYICIGGAKTYEKYCHLFTELHISQIFDETVGDTLYPDLTNINPDCKIFHYYFDADK